MNLNKLVPVAAVVVAGSFFTAKADLLADWTFETTSPTTAGPFSADIGSGTAMGFHAGTSVYSHPSGNGSTNSFSSNGWAVNDYYQFEVSTLGYASGILLSFDQTSSSTGPGHFSLEYSTDDSTFTTFTSYAPLVNGTPNTAWNVNTYNSAFTITEDLSSISSLTNQATVYFRLADATTTTPSGGTVATGGTDRVDNFTVTTVPEPGSLVLAAVGGIACLVAFRRRS